VAPCILETLAHEGDDAHEGTGVCPLSPVKRHDHSKVRAQHEVGAGSVLTQQHGRPTTRHERIRGVHRRRHDSVVALGLEIVAVDCEMLCDSAVWLEALTPSRRIPREHLVAGFGLGELELDAALGVDQAWVDHQRITLEDFCARRNLDTCTHRLEERTANHDVHIRNLTPIGLHHRYTCKRIGCGGRRGRKLGGDPRRPERDHSKRSQHSGGPGGTPLNHLSRCPVWRLTCSQQGTAVSFPRRSGYVKAGMPDCIFRGEDHPEARATRADGLPFPRA
jgi:hypothetical protein